MIPLRNINCFGERERGEREGGRGREGEGGREGAMTCRNKVERERKEKQGVERGGREGERGGRERERGGREREEEGREREVG